MGEERRKSFFLAGKTRTSSGPQKGKDYKGVEVEKQLYSKVQKAQGGGSKNGTGEGPPVSNGAAAEYAQGQTKKNGWSEETKKESVRLHLSEGVMGRRALFLAKRSSGRGYLKGGRQQSAGVQAKTHGRDGLRKGGLALSIGQPPRDPGPSSS